MAGQIGNTPHSRLVDGLELLQQWADGATQLEKNAIYKALFAVADGTVRRSYQVVDHEAREFTVLVKEDLVVRVIAPEPGVFGIAFMGRVGATTG